MGSSAQFIAETTHNTFHRVIVLGIFDLVYRTSVSTHMNKSMSMVMG
jgi:hypothetical protein